MEVYLMRLAITFILGLGWIYLCNIQEDLEQDIKGYKPEMLRYRIRDMYRFYYLKTNGYYLFLFGIAVSMAAYIVPSNMDFYPTFSNIHLLFIGVNAGMALWAVGEVVHMQSLPITQNGLYAFLQRFIVWRKRMFWLNDGLHFCMIANLAYIMLTFVAIVAY